VIEKDGAMGKGQIYFCCLGDAFAEDFNFEVTDIGV